MFEKIIDLIKKYPKIIIHRHEKPDGDAMGSQIGLMHIIKDTWPEKTVFVVGDTSPRYSFIAGREMDVIDDEEYKGALAIVLDTSAAALISDKRFPMADATARLDHHIFVEKICDEEVTDTSYESCCGLITEMAMESGLTVSQDAARALYTGMVTDSGRFHYDSTTANTHKLASFLMERRFSTSDIYKVLYADELKNVQLRAKFALRINVTDNKVGYIYTTSDEVKEYGADPFYLSRGMVNVMGDIKGIDTWVNFTECDGAVLCEIRSKVYNINPIAVKYGGGGHKKASGATLKSREEAMMLLADLNSLTEADQ